jgi:hypothetical protein
MTPKQTAEELTNKYFKGSDLLYHDLSWIQAKECALIAVEEIIEEVLRIEDNEGHYIDSKYWQQVKKEIEKL